MYLQRCQRSVTHSAEGGSTRKTVLLLQQKETNKPCSHQDFFPADKLAGEGLIEHVVRKLTELTRKGLLLISVQGKQMQINTKKCYWFVKPKRIPVKQSHFHFISSVCLLEIVLYDEKKVTF